MFTYLSITDVLLLTDLKFVNCNFWGNAKYLNANIFNMLPTFYNKNDVATSPKMGLVVFNKL